MIERVQPQESDYDDDEGASRKNIKLHENETQDIDEYHREKDALEIQRQHEQFMDTQARKAGQYVKRMRQRQMTVSSKKTVEDTKRPGMEGKGPRVVPQSVKNYRKRLKKKVKRNKSSDVSIHEQ